MHSDDPPGMSVSRGAALSMIGILALGSTRLLYSVVVGRVDGKATLGTVNTAISFAMLATLFVSAGTGSAAAKFVAAAEGAGRRSEALGVSRTLGRWTALGTLVSVAGAAALLPWTLRHVGAATSVTALALLVAYAAYTFTKGLLYGFGRIRRYTVLEVCSDVAVLALTGAALLLGRGWLVLPLVAGYAGFSLWAWLSRPKGAGTELAQPRRREMRAFVLIAVIGTVTSTGFLQLSQLVAHRYGSRADAGLYAAALTLVTPAYFLPRALSVALFPSMAGAFARGQIETIRRQADLGTRIIAVGMLPLFAGAVFLAEPILHVFYGAGFAGGAVVLAVLLAATYISVLPVSAVNSLSAVEAKYARVTAYSSSAGLLVGVLWWLVLTPRQGVVAVAVGYLVGSLVQTGVPMAVAWWRYRLGWTGLSLRLAAGCTVVVAAAFVLHRDAGGLLPAAAAALVFAAGWCAVCRSDLRLLVERLPRRG